MLYQTIKMVDDRDWDDLVCKTYGRVYCFQQQNGCVPPGIYHLTVPDKHEEPNADPIDHGGWGVRFSRWLSTDPTYSPDPNWSPMMVKLWWKRDFYPDIQAVANDLHSKGLLEAGDYVINIDW